MKAVQNCQSKVVQFLAKENSDVNDRHSDGWTVLMLAAQESNAEIVQMLIDATANVHATDNLMRTALMLAVKSGHVDTVQALINAGANVNATDLRGYTPLFFAPSIIPSNDNYRERRSQIVEILADRKANVNMRNLYMCTIRAIPPRKWCLNDSFKPKRDINFPI